MQLADVLYIVILLFGFLVQGAVLVFSKMQRDMRRQAKLFRNLTMCSMTISLVDTAARLVSCYRQPDELFNGLGYLTNQIYFFLQAMVASMWFIYAMRELKVKWIGKKELLCLALLPIGLLMLLVIGFGQRDLLFYIDEANAYHRGPWYMIYPAICVIYMLVPSFLALKMARMHENYVHRSKLITIALFSLIVLPFVLMQSLITSDWPMFCPGYTLAILVVFTNQQNLRITIDELTGVSNRSTAMRFLAYKMEGQEEENQTPLSLYVMMVDIDKFKQINDTWGHVEGDAALMRTASVLKKSVPRNFFIGRYGGDEFIIIGEATREEEIQEVCEAIHENIELANYQAMMPYTYTVSVGYAVRNGQIGTLLDFIKAADVNLYRKKSARREE